MNEQATTLSWCEKRVDVFGDHGAISALKAWLGANGQPIGYQAICLKIEHADTPEEPGFPERVCSWENHWQIPMEQSHVGLDQPNRLSRVFFTPGRPMESRYRAVVRKIDLEKWDIEMDWRYCPPSLAGGTDCRAAALWLVEDTDRV